ncbi:hypothetical protein NOC27_1359 [Nitrosococcus oceani AFC27]|nr:hypothetical protein NOC27_1359 [Nitrosococcus oceani AFC27]
MLALNTARTYIYKMFFHQYFVGGKEVKPAYTSPTTGVI